MKYFYLIFNLENVKKLCYSKHKTFSLHDFYSIFYYFFFKYFIDFQRVM